MALLVKLQTEVASPPIRKHRMFRFEAFWMCDPNCEDIIKSSWDSLQWGTPIFRVTQKIKAIRVALLLWGGGNARGLIQSINTKRGLLTNLELECHLDPSNQHLSNARNAIRSELNELVAQENTYWLQRLNISWMKDGDRNSKFFHAVASQRRSNEIQKLQDSSGRWHSQQFDLKRVASDYFQSMFTSASTSFVEHVINHVCEVVTPDMNGILLAKFTHDEEHERSHYLVIGPRIIVDSVNEGLTGPY
nr:hypothetical protein CFP56_09735 [Quercus suber]